MRDPYDRGSKWLIEHYGDALLRLGGVAGIGLIRQRTPPEFEVGQAF